MTPPICRAAKAELAKLATLPAFRCAALVMTAAGVALTTLHSTAPTGETTAAAAVARAVPFLQVGPILLGVLAAATEYDGGQIRTTLTAVPNRTTALTGKAAACLAAAGATTTATAALATARLAADPTGREPTSLGSPCTIVGIVAYLVLISLLAHGLAITLRSAIPPLAIMLTLVLIASPLLSEVTDYARWLPDQAGKPLYQPSPTPCTPWNSAVILLLWTTATSLAAATTFLKRDA
ncbi:hypothetical protein ACPA54_05015 [Uniformispora flossi]|uniref:hypothetical protein n=1 Tax=Uniformispora flossi TaxID=3390723 RepID=UPI003C2B578B